MNLAIGAQMYTVRSHTQTAAGMRDALLRVGNMGYRYVQLSGQSQAIEPQIIRDALDEFKLQAPTTHVSFDLMQSDFDTLVKQHRLWGAMYPGAGSMPARYSSAGLEGFKLFARDASQVARKFKDEGMTFIYHNHNFEFVNFGGVTGYEVLLNESDPALQFELDTYWVQAGGGDPAAWIRRLSGRMDVIHFKDMEIVREESGGPVKQVFSEIGQGNLNWDAIFTACAEINVRYAFVEQDTTRRETPFESLRISRDYLTGHGFRENPSI